MPKYVLRLYMLYFVLWQRNPRPTVDAKAELVKTASLQAEDTRVQLRRLEQTSIKKGNHKKNSGAWEEVCRNRADTLNAADLFVRQYHELSQKNIKDVDQILADMKSKMGVK